ncbi:thermonuclease family protein [Ferviditalea candida]|uniref:Thermonuclease family protein n=1 Tax=Ferviditalea candida TaxID=3108399 RepID=A0ABU5ZEB8_9BACL|nr:thermonuclease family protein [Paenibacillaceae bacterium T2]
MTLILILAIALSFGTAVFTAAGLYRRDTRKAALGMHSIFLLLLLSAGLTGCAPHPSSKPAASVQKLPGGNLAQENSGLPSSNVDKLSETADSGNKSRRLINASIVRVIDGDTMEVSLGRQTEKIRLLLVDTPETVHPEKPVEPFGPEASAFAKDTLSGQNVQLELDVSERDKYGRVLVYLWHDGRMFNEMLLEKGLARVAYVYPPNVKYVDEFRQIQKKAQLAGIGIWSIENYAREDGFHDEVAGNLPETGSSVTKPAPSEGPGAASNPGSSPISGLRVVSVTSPVTAGGYATLTAETAPGASAGITVYYKSGPSKASGLQIKQADARGRVSWTWKVGNRTTPGTWRIAVTSEGKTVETQFEVR